MVAPEGASPRDRQHPSRLSWRPTSTHVVLSGNAPDVGVAHYEAEHLKATLDLMIRTREHYT